MADVVVSRPTINEDNEIRWGIEVVPDTQLLPDETPLPEGTYSGDILA